MIRLNPVTNDEEKRQQVYKSRVADIDEKFIAIDMPSNETEGHVGFFYVGTAWRVSYNGADGSFIDFQTEVVGKRVENVPLILLRKVEKHEIHRLQRRSYIRLDVKAEIAVKTLDHEPPYHFLAVTEDLSGGGLSFTCDPSLQLKAEEQLELWMALPNRGGVVTHAYAIGQITRTTPPDGEREGQLVSVKFVDISESDRSKVMRSCFDKQVELRKKGLLE